MNRIYEGMFLLDNDTVRAGWQQAKTVVTGLIEKHGGTVRAARRWDERKLAYPIRRRRRATFLLAYFEMAGTSGPALLRDLDINERILRYLMLRRDAVPAEEVEKSELEAAEGFVIPEPPADDASEEEAAARRDEDDSDDDDSGGSSDSDDDSESSEKETPRKKTAAVGAKSGESE